MGIDHDCFGRYRNARMHRAIVARIAHECIVDAEARLDRLARFPKRRFAFPLFYL
jgi:hypothetical protein